MNLLKNTVKGYLFTHSRFGVLAFGLLECTTYLGLRRAYRNMEAFLKRIKKLGFRPQSAVDVGAYVGQWSRILKKVFKETEVTMIEPLEEMKPFLNRFCARFPDTRYFTVGAGPIVSDGIIKVTKNLANASFADLTNNRFESRKVQVVSIDALIEKEGMPIPDLVKIDVEGFEKEVLKGCRLCFGATEAFIIEVSFDPLGKKSYVMMFDEIMRFLDSKGYVLFDIIDVKRSGSIGILEQADVCFVRRNGVLNRP